MKKMTDPKRQVIGYGASPIRMSSYQGFERRHRYSKPDSMLAGWYAIMLNSDYNTDHLLHILSNKIHGWPSDGGDITDDWIDDDYTVVDDWVDDFTNRSKMAIPKKK